MRGAMVPTIKNMTRDLRSIKNIPYTPKLEYDLIPKRLKYLSELSVLAASRQGYKIIYPS